MTSRDLRDLLLALALVAVVCVGPILLVGASADLLLAAPALLLALPLLAGRYVGEAAVERLVALRRGARRRVRRVAGPAGRRAAAMVPRGGALLGFARAVRPPPPAIATR